MVALAPLITAALQLTIGLVKAAKESKELSEKEFEDIKIQLANEFVRIPTWDEL